MIYSLSTEVCVERLKRELMMKYTRDINRLECYSRSGSLLTLFKGVKLQQLCSSGVSHLADHGG